MIDALFKSEDRKTSGRADFPPFHGVRQCAARAVWAGLILTGFPGFAETTNSLSLPGSTLPEVGVSFLRVMGALAVVLAVFLGGVWVVRNWQRLVIHRGRAPRLNVLETRSLGGRHSLYVVGYEQERFLIASSPTGVNLVSHLSPADEANDAAPDIKNHPQPSFAQALTQMLKGK